MHNDATYLDAVRYAESNNVKASDQDQLLQLIHQHLDFIERQCYNMVRRQYGRGMLAMDRVMYENDVLELNNVVLDRLQADDFRVLRQFSGRAKLTTYLTTIIANQAVDLLRKHKGRNRGQERARQLGAKGELVFQLLFVEKRTIAEAKIELMAKLNQDIDEKEIGAIADAIRGPATAVHMAMTGESAVKAGRQHPESGELIIPDGKASPEERFLDQQKNERMAALVSELVQQLSAEERLLLRMKFPAPDAGPPLSADEMAGVLGIRVKAVYKKVETIFKRCRVYAAKKGIKIHEWI